MAEARLPTRLPRGRILSRVALGLLCLAGGAACSTAAEAVMGELQLRNGDHWAGQFAEGSPPNVIRWQSPIAEAPFDFVPASVGAAYFSSPPTATSSSAPFCVELAGGDMLFGSLEALSDQELVIANPHFGKLTISTASVARVLPWGDSSSIRYLGPNGLHDWKTEATNVVPISRRNAVGQMRPVEEPTPVELGWREAAGQLIIDKPSQAIASECPIPATCSIELSLGWQRNPDFGVTLFVEEQEGEGVFPIRLQVVKLESKVHQLIAIVEGEKSADLVPLVELNPEGGHFHAIIYVDAEARSAEIRSIDGKPIGRLELPPKEVKVEEEEGEPDPAQQARQRRIRPARVAPSPTPPKRTKPGIVVVNRGASLRFERLLVRGWNGQLPLASEANEGVVVTGKNHVSWKRVVFDPATNELVSSNGEQETRTPLADVASLTFPPSTVENTPAYRMMLHDGTRVSGTLQTCRDGNLEVQSAAIREPLKTPTPLVSSLVSMLPAETGVPELNGRRGRLDVQGLRSQGVLVEGSQAGTSPLVWLPWGAITPQPLASDITGRIVYRKPQPTVDEAQANIPNQRVRNQPQPQPRGLFQMIIGGGGARPTSGPASQPRPQPQPQEEGVIFMRSGDRFPGKLVRITETAAQFESSVIEATSIPLEEMTMWERDRESQLDGLDPEKRRRLLTIPRMQRNNPPTHLLETYSGDFLRARLIRIEGDQVIVEVRLEEKEIALSTIRRILWLDGTSDVVTDIVDEVAPAEPTDGSPTEPVVLAVAKDNTRLAFTPLKMEGGILSGVSQHLGDCQVKLADIDVLFLGAQAARQSLVDEVAKWKMTPAKDPKFVSEDDADDPSRAGLDAPLVGEPAPDFTLATLGEKQFKLSEQKGKIVVLDFFATWCGPCIQAMPEVDSIAAEFKDQGVELVAVNMQEDATSVKRLLERLKIEPTVALDIDGATAEKYGVTAIPQTVIVDRDGKVARLYVGGGPTFAAQLREALKSLTDQPAAGDTAEAADTVPTTTGS